MFVTHLYVFFEKCLFRSFPHFLIGLFVFLVLSCMSCLYILEINPLSVVSFAIIFSHSEGCLFTLFIVSFSGKKAFQGIFIVIAGEGRRKEVLLRGLLRAWHQVRCCYITPL